MSDDVTVPVATIWRGGEPVYDRADAVCVIGAGAAGLAAVKNLRERGFAVDCYERETGVGGSWNPRNGHVPAGGSTHLITSRPCSQFPDFPMPDDWPDYPSHARTLSYLERYADHFGLREHIWFGTEVARVEPAGDTSKWDVTIKGQRGGVARLLRYAAVIVATGHTSEPLRPSWEAMSSFRGKIIHSHDYQDASQLRGKRVLVVGAGNAGCEIAAQAGTTAGVCWHSSRRGYWQIPKYLFGRPFDQLAVEWETSGLSQWSRRSRLRRAVRAAVGDLTRFGLPTPDHEVDQSHPIVNSQLLYQIGHGGVLPVPDISRFGRSDVTCVDGRVIDPELVILATGYRPTFDFLDREVVARDEVGLPTLRWHLLSPQRPTLAFVGLIEPDTNALACAHWQSVLVASWLRSKEAADDGGRGFWERHADADRRRYHRRTLIDSPRHRLEVNHLTYLRELERALNDLEAVR